jgi:hypothetical protein
MCVVIILTCLQGVVVLSLALAEEPEDHVQAAAAWALGQIGRHTPEHSKAVAQANVFPRLLQCYTRSGASEDLQTKVGKTSISFIVYQMCILIFLENYAKRCCMFGIFKYLDTGSSHICKLALF